MSPAVKLGNWLRKVCPWIRKSTAPLTEDGSELEQELSVVDQIVLSVLDKSEVRGEGFSRDKSYYVLVGDLTLTLTLGGGCRVAFQGADIGASNSTEVLYKINTKLYDYHRKLDESLEAELVKSKQKREARLLEILREVSNK